ncbi:hypothetical protein BKA80DRAFT_143784 [Phyllosticta citrichinensis]
MVPPCSHKRCFSFDLLWKAADESSSIRSNMASPVDTVTSCQHHSSPSRRRLDGINDDLDDHDHRVTQRRPVLLVNSLLRPRILPPSATPPFPPALALPPRLLAPSVIRVVFAVHGGRSGRDVAGHALVLDVRCWLTAVQLELLVVMGLADGGGSGRWGRGRAAVCCRGRRRRMCVGGRMVLWLHRGSAHRARAVFVGHGGAGHDDGFYNGNVDEDRRA